MLLNKFSPVSLSTWSTQIQKTRLQHGNLYQQKIPFRWETSHTAGVAVIYLGVDRDAQLLAAAEQRLKEAHLLAAKRSQRLEASSWGWVEMEIWWDWEVVIFVFFFELVYLHHRDMGDKNMTTYRN